MEATLSQNIISDIGPDTDFKNLFFDRKITAAKTTINSKTEPTTPPESIMKVGISMNR